MKTARIAKLILDIRSGFWFRPIVMLGSGVAASLFMTYVDRWMIEAGWTSPLADMSPGGARALLSVAAGALATTLAIALSMTMVTVQLASSQYTPRLLRRFLSDRFTQGVLGSFLATISFLFLALRAVRSPDEGSVFVPMLSLGLAVLATLACLALLVVFLHRTMRAMQASTIIASIGRETVKMIEPYTADGVRPLTAPLQGPRQVVHANTAGYVQLLDDSAIRSALAPIGSAIRREANPGDFILPGTPLVTVFDGELLSDDVVDCVREAFTLGSERTPEADSMFGVRQLVDVALKALSPGINDVTTAVMVVNELGVIAGALAHTGLVYDVERLHDPGISGMYVTRDVSLERYLDLAFSEIIEAAHPHSRVHRRILEVLGTVYAVEPNARPLLYAFTQDMCAPPSPRRRRSARLRAWACFTTGARSPGYR